MRGRKKAEREACTAQKNRYPKKALSPAQKREYPDRALSPTGRTGQTSGTNRASPLRRLTRFAARLAVLAAALALFLWWNNHALQVTETEVPFPDLPAGFDGFRVAVLSDLHGAAFGADNEKLFRAVAETRPEMIFLLGDLEDSYRGPVPGYAETIADGLTAIAPVWYVTGNHEWAIGSVKELKARLKDHGVTVLSNDFEIIDRNGDGLIIAGIDDPNGYADQRTPEELAELIDTSDPNYFWLLLAHRNNLFPTRYCKLGAGLVLSGHGHGGLIRLPFTDGLIDTNLTLFPSWTAGLYEKDGSTLFVTRGLGNSGSTFRLFNRPEIAVLTLRRAG